MQRGIALATESSASQYAVSISFSRLQEHYLLWERPDLLFPVMMGKLATAEARRAQILGRRDNYFALLDASCQWAEASKLARAAGRPEAALFLAKVAVNRLQDARRRIADLDGDIRECFVEVHRDRYRLLADIFMDLGRLSEAEHVLAMLKDFEHYSYTRNADQRGASLDICR